MRVTRPALSGLLVLELRIFRDDRGHFLELWNERRYREAGLDVTFVQDNASTSRRGAVRGLHFQHPSGQAKLVSVLQGEVWDVAVDIRRGSPTFGEWHGLKLSAENGTQFYIPEGFAHGFAVLSETALVSYKCTDFYEPSCERTLLWNDPVLAIEWPVEDPIVSEKDAAGIRLVDMPPESLPSSG
jgi:dTDP-4-dehydrorhamnose 3,5-epimerase